MGQNIKYRSIIKYRKKSYNLRIHVVVNFTAALIKYIPFQTCFKYSQRFAIFESGVHIVPNNWSLSCEVKVVSCGDV